VRRLRVGEGKWEKQGKSEGGGFEDRLEIARSLVWLAKSYRVRLLKDVNVMVEAELLSLLERVMITFSNIIQFQSIFSAVPDRCGFESVFFLSSEPLPCEHCWASDEEHVRWVASNGLLSIISFPSTFLIELSYIAHALDNDDNNDHERRRRRRRRKRTLKSEGKMRNKESRRSELICRKKVSEVMRLE